MLGIFEAAGGGAAVTDVINGVRACELKWEGIWREMRR